MAEPGDDPEDGPTDEALRELLRAEHHRAAVDDRRRLGELQRQAAESVSLLDVVRGLAATGQLAAVRTRSGPVPPSTVVEVGPDHVVLRRHGPETVLVPAASIAAVRPAGSAPAPVGAPATPAADLAGFQERVTDLALRRPRVRASFAGDVVAGQLRRVGLDHLVITQDDGTDVVVALPALDELAL